MQFVDALESRRLLAGNEPLSPLVGAKLSHTGTLFVNGSSLRDTISLTSDGAIYFLTVGSPSRSAQVTGAKIKVHIDTKLGGGNATEFETTFDQSKVKRIKISGGAGDDYIDVNVGVRGSAIIYGGRGDDRIRTAGKKNALYGESGDDTLISDRSVAIMGVYALPDGSAGAEHRISQAGFNLLDGGIGNDTFSSRGGEDTIVGGSGDDEFVPLERGIQTTAGTSLPTVAPGNLGYIVSRVAIDDAGISSTLPDTDKDVEISLDDAYTYLPSSATPKRNG